MDFINDQRTNWVFRYSDLLNIRGSRFNQATTPSSLRITLLSFFQKFLRILPKVQRQIDLDFGDDSNQLGG